MLLGPHLHMVMRIGNPIDDFKTFKWRITGDGTLEYLGNRSDHECRYPELVGVPVETRPPGHAARRASIRTSRSRTACLWKPIGGDLTIKIEDNTATGQGIYAEPVDDPDQTLDDAEILYAHRRAADHPADPALSGNAAPPSGLQ